MDIEGLGEAVLEAFVSNSLISTPADIYGIKAEDIAKIERLGDKSASNLVAAIEKSKQAGLARLVYALGIRHIGQKAGKLLADKFRDIDALVCATTEEVASIEGFGEIMAESVTRYFSKPESRELIERLREHGVVMSGGRDVKDNRFEGKVFVLTGTLPTYTRQQASEIIESFGGKTASSVSKKTHFVLAGEDAGSKLRKATELGIRIISEDEFSQMIL